jgi:hypothetical protein
MGRATILALRIVLMGALAGSVFVQAVMLQLLFRDLDGADQEVLALRTPLVVILVLGIVTTRSSWSACGGS